MWNGNVEQCKQICIINCFSQNVAYTLASSVIRRKKIATTTKKTLTTAQQPKAKHSNWKQNAACIILFSLFLKEHKF